MTDKRMTLNEASRLVQNGDTVFFGGNVLHRAPLAMARELARAGKKDLHLVKTAGAMEVDLLCLADAVSTVDAGFISYESEFSLANHFRRAVQDGRVIMHEHACYTVISALRAAAYGIPFMPVEGLKAGDLLEANDFFAEVTDPFSGKKMYAVRAIQPDVAIVHVQEAERNGNALIRGPKFEDVLGSRAAKKVIVTAERIVPDNRFFHSREKADIPHFLVDAVVQCPKGAFPASCPELYDIDRRNINRFKEIKTKDELGEYLSETEAMDH